MKLVQASTGYSPEERQWAVRMVLGHQGEYESQCEAICSIAGKMGCAAETSRKWGGRPSEGCALN